MSWSTLPVTVAQVREYLDVEGTTGKYSDGLIGSNIRAAASFIEHATGRQFEEQVTATKSFTTNGMAAMRIPDLQSVSSATLQGVTLDADESYWLIADSRQTGNYTGIQFRAFGQGGVPSYRSNPEWFDRNLDRDFYRYGTTSLPNDLVIVGTWGYDINSMPHDFLMAVKALAAWYTRRPASVMANVAFTPDGNVLNYAEFPPEFSAFVPLWRLGAMLVAV